MGASYEQLLELILTRICYTFNHAAHLLVKVGEVPAITDGDIHAFGDAGTCSYISIRCSKRVESGLAVGLFRQTAASAMP